MRLLTCRIRREVFTFNPQLLQANFFMFGIPTINRVLLQHGWETVRFVGMLSVLKWMGRSEEGGTPDEVA